jgi:hypothetical protein
MSTGWRKEVDVDKATNADAQPKEDLSPTGEDAEAITGGKTRPDAKRPGIKRPGIKRPGVKRV